MIQANLVSNTSSLTATVGDFTVVGGGVTDYEQLTNKPSINGVTLIGNKTLAQLGIEFKAEGLTNEEIDSTW